MANKRNQYSTFERTCAKLLSQFPYLKEFFKINYQKANYFLRRPESSFICDFEIQTIEDNNNETFFGYYDKSPINISNEFIIFQSSSLDTSRLPSPKIPIDVVLYELKSNSIVARFKTYTYNWQQGCKLQWISNNEFIFNSVDKNNEYCAYIVDTSNLLPRKVKFPVYDVATDKIAYTLNFDRLAILRPDYGYFNHLPYDLSNDLKSDGVYKLNLEDGDCRLIVSLEQLLEKFPINIQGDITHKVNHIMCSPFGESILFLHRYFVRGVKYDRLISCDKDGNDLKILASDGMVSHCCWLNNNTIIGYLRQYESGDKYYQINIKNGDITQIGNGLISGFGDGHPTVLKNRMIFDTYPDKSRMKSLFLFDIGTGKLSLLGQFLEPLKFYGQTRCDLHPKWSFDGKRIFFDSVHTGKRKLYFIDLTCV
jgi:hypothetical protein